MPVDALLALAGGGYAVEVAEGRVHHLVAVTLGLFDDAEGLVQVSGPGLSGRAARGGAGDMSSARGGTRRRRAWRAGSRRARRPGRRRRCWSCEG